MNWEPWTGCYKVSDGCTYCYFYGPYAKRYGQNTITKTEEFNKPIAKSAKGIPKISSGKIVATCFASDFFIAEADEWRKEAWAMIKSRPDLEFLILTKRIDRFNVSLPADWSAGYDNVNIGCTVENQEIADFRLPLFLSYPIKRRFVACAPLLGAIDLSKYLGGIEHVSVGGETSREAEASMEVKIIESNKKDFLDLLLLADEEEAKIDKYLERGELFALYDGDLKSVCVVTRESDDVCELKNIATYEKWNGKGYGSKLLNHIFLHYKGKYTTMLVGTGDIP